MAWIETVSPEAATGMLKDAYDWQARRLGAPTDYTQLGSLFPDLVMLRLQLYKTVEACPSGLSPIERELAALVTSVLNETPHCASGLRLKLESLGMPRATIDAVCADPRTVQTGDARQDAIVAYAAKLTLTPGAMTQQDVEELRGAGLDDLEILDVNNMVAYYCYTNRVANGLGLRTEVTSTREATLALPA
jgi:uncharacterized peroxidase-related enzyme